jgi:hypothetical protein
MSICKKPSFRQQFRLSRGEPSRGCRALALRAAAIAAGVEGDPCVRAVLAALDVATEGRCATGFDCFHDALLLTADMTRIGRAPGFAMTAKNIGELQLCWRHLASPRPGRRANRYAAQPPSLAPTPRNGVPPPAAAGGKARPGAVPEPARAAELRGRLRAARPPRKQVRCSAALARADFSARNSQSDTIDPGRRENTCHRGTIDRGKSGYPRPHSAAGLCSARHYMPPVLRADSTARKRKSFFARFATPLSFHTRRNPRIEVI